MHWSGGWWHVGGMGLLWLAIAAIIALAVYLAVRVLRQSAPPRESAREILEKRYARGEIDREEFETAMKELRLS